MKLQQCRVLSATLLASVATAQAGSGNAMPAEESRANSPWIDRPWDIRYVLRVDDEPAWQRWRARAAKKNADPKTAYPLWNEFFEPRAIVDAGLSPVWGEQRFAIVAIEFDRNGVVTSKHTHAGPLRGRLTQRRRITLSEGDAVLDRRFDLGEWFLGVGDASTHWAPALCDSAEMPGPFGKTDEGYRYGPRFKPRGDSATFGCREWAAQLYDDQRPYIDVTSYVPKEATYPQGTYIRPFIGWARPMDHKPVIGRHENRWYCLHDCPAGEAPGKIADIHAWAKRHGWPTPKRPTRSPVFPDPPAVPGHYPL